MVTAILPDASGRATLVPELEIVDGLPEALLLVDADGRMVYVNRAAERLFGHAAGALLGREVFMLAPAARRAQHARYLRRFFSAPERRPMGRARDLRAVDASGREIPVDIELAPIVAGARTLACVTIRDISDRVAALNDIRRQERRLRALFDENPSVLLRVDRTLTIREINRYGAEFFGQDAVTLVGRPVTELVYGADREAVRAEFGRAFGAPGEVFRSHVRTVVTGRADCWLRFIIRAIRNGEGDDYALVVAEDVTKSLQLSRKLSHQATHDQLTGLINRLGFEQRVAALADADAEPGSRHSLCFIDLDQFKVVNDTCGHLAGDQLLVRVATVLRRAARRGDIAARLGGDEFALVFENCEQAKAAVLVESLMEEIRAIRFHWADYTFSVGMSAGLVEFEAGERQLDDILKKADAACYAAKEKGRGRTQCYEEQDAQMVRAWTDMHWAARLQRALDGDEFELWAQPIVEVMREPWPPGRVEILIRLKSGTGELIMPGAFLPAAERFGFASRIDEWVVRHTLAWLDTLPEPDRPECSINLSGQSIGDPQFRETLPTLLGAKPRHAARIVFEITETATISNLGDALAFMAELKRLGCRFALDDFGSGMSSFAYLKTIPVDYIKIDGAFVRNMERDRLDYMIVQSVTEMAHLLGKRTIAEWVESPGLLAELRSIGVDFAQGYGLGRPRPLHELGPGKPAAVVAAG